MASRMKSARFSPSASNASMRASVPAISRAGVCSSLIFGRPTREALSDITISGNVGMLLISPIDRQSDIRYIDDIRYGDKQMTEKMPFIADDGGREAAGFKGTAGDCVARAVAIAAELPYAEVCRALADGMGSQRVTKHTKSRHARKASARNGVSTRRKWFKDYMAALGFEWTPTMAIGQGCKVHLVAGELPGGRLIVAVSRHYTAVIDGAVHDTYDPQRHSVEIGVKDGVPYRKEYDRCVYGFWSRPHRGAA
jgi:hypothetical protein